jgi:hypothetical protein
MALCLYKENVDCIAKPLEGICADCRIRLISADAQFASIDWQQTNGFVMIEKSCHTCKFGTYENQEEFNRAAVLTCEKRAEVNDGKIVDPKCYVCNLWQRRKNSLFCFSS